MRKPERIFARDQEWAHLTRFADVKADRPQLGVISGRRRQGKTYLVEGLAEQTGGLYFGATQATETESLAQFAAAIAAHLDSPVPPRFDSWDDAVRFFFSIDAPGPFVIDEFPYLSQVSPVLPSILQREIDRATSAGRRTKVLLCGSAMSVMGGLLSGTAPLRGRATLELVVRPFDYLLAAQYWGVEDPGLAALLHSVVGGTPAYRRFVNDDAPESLEDFDDWVLRTVLSPASPLFREARYLLEEEMDVRDSALYHSVLAAVASGNRTRGGIANYVGRKATDIGHQLNVLEDSGLLRRRPDLFRSGRSGYEVAEPLIVFYQVVMRPQWGLLESGRSATVWEAARPRFSSQVVGPHFEQLCREYAMSAPAERFGELPGEIGSGVVPDHYNRSQIEVDVAVLAPAVSGHKRKVLSLGEAKWGEVMGRRHVSRLERARHLLSRDYDTSETVLACYSGAGFEPGLDSSVLTVGLDDLYRRAN
ncbi:ATP-binding protein [Kribbella sp. CA-293567]|uniref:ATP-binding protein n=1 Tax=Kribbella sp. CA-293567 TaxID=3002436 RepID=UPI0022DE564C|nr:ATP-binding protein [Kribbella sp. CA-293567]WBQ05526.1 ATP-binding protein [Kribbella sp. CA-293567]